uniref:Uncharacterized protein n=1 Tax=Eutreptiella gymnastica TaxID=73025 RepID=A0A7S1IUI9_9EUGL
MFSAKRYTPIRKAAANCSADRHLANSSVVYAPWVPSYPRGPHFQTGDARSQQPYECHTPEQVDNYAIEWMCRVPAMSPLPLVIHHVLSRAATTAHLPPANPSDYVAMPL